MNRYPGAVGAGPHRDGNHAAVEERRERAMRLLFSNAQATLSGELRGALLRARPAT
jgi:hypothetical protein